MGWIQLDKNFQFIFSKDPFGWILLNADTTVTMKLNQGHWNRYENLNELLYKVWKTSLSLKGRRTNFERKFENAVISLEGTNLLKTHFVQQVEEIKLKHLHNTIKGSAKKCAVYFILISETRFSGWWLAWLEVQSNVECLSSSVTYDGLFFFFYVSSLSSSIKWLPLSSYIPCWVSIKGLPSLFCTPKFWCLAQEVGAHFIWTEILNSNRLQSAFSQLYHLMAFHSSNLANHHSRLFS